MNELVTIRIWTEGEAFGDEPATEIAGILRGLAEAFELGSAEVMSTSPLLDSNGEQCGCCVIARLEDM